MYFSGDSSTPKRVDLGGRSTKERDRDRQKLVEQTKLERNRRLWLRQQNSAAIKIQKCFRGRKIAAAERSKLREQFYGTYGKDCQNVDRFCFGLDSKFLGLLLFFFDARSVGDFSILVETCRLLQQFATDTGDIVSIFAGMDSSKNHLINHRVKKLAYMCIKAVHQNRNQFKYQLAAPEESTVPTTLLLEAVVLLIDPKLPWACKTVSYLLKKKAFTLFREIILTGQGSIKTHNYTSRGSSLERSLAVASHHIGQEPCTCPNIDPHWSFSLQILTIPFLWKRLPNLGQVFATPVLSQHYIHQMALCVQNCDEVLTNDTSIELPGYVCLLGNILESSSVALSQPDCSFEMAVDLVAVATFLLEGLPSIKAPNRESREDFMLGEDDMTDGDDTMEIILNNDLKRQICDAMDTRFLQQLTSVLCLAISLVSGSHNGPDDKEMTAVGSACAFLHVIFKTLPLGQSIMTILAYGTELVPVLWNFIKRCHENKKWLASSEKLAYLVSGDAAGWLLPLTIFCHVYKNMLTIVDHEEFYEQEKPLSLRDIRCLIIILRQALWQLLWVDPTTPTNSVKSVTNTHANNKRHPVEFVQQRFCFVASELLSQLQDWNNRQEFTSPSDFHADGVDDFFISQALTENTRANDVLKQAPFLVPFTSKVKIFTSQWAAVRQRYRSESTRKPTRKPTRKRLKKRWDRLMSDPTTNMCIWSLRVLLLHLLRQGHGSNPVFTRAQFIIRQDPILKDACNQHGVLLEDDLQGPSQLAAARQRHGSNSVFTRNRFRIRRDCILEDACNQINALLEDDLRGPIHVTFVDKFGVEEAGIDGGGIFKDLMENITREAFDVQYGLFKETSDHLLYPNPCVGMIDEQHLQFFHLLGIILAKAMFEGILVDIPFAKFFLRKLKQKYNYLNDMPSLDPELYRHLVFLKHYKGDISELGLYFVIENNEYGVKTEKELLPRGKNLRVTNENVITYIHLVANHHLNFQIRQQSSHFLRGFQQLIPKDWIDMFNEHELQLLISGSLDSLDVGDLRMHTKYFGYDSEHPVIEMLWEILESFSLENQKKFLKFVTGCSGAPLLGFKYLEPLFCIQRAADNAIEGALEQLPTSATCMNLLKLPPYKSREQLKTKLLDAICAYAGFGLR